MEKLVQRLVKDELRFRKKVAVLGYARDVGSNAKAWTDFEIPKSTFYLWKKTFEKEGISGLKRKKPIPHRLNNNLLGAYYFWMYQNQVLNFCPSQS